jgi:hypothetical protein
MLYTLMYNDIATCRFQFMVSKKRAILRVQAEIPPHNRKQTKPPLFQICKVPPPHALTVAIIMALSLCNEMSFQSLFLPLHGTTDNGCNVYT